jgi:hypothetical protein
MEGGGTGDSGPLSTATALFGLIAGLVAGIYVLGGLVLTIRLLFDGYRPESIVAVVGQLPRTLVVTTALLEVIGPAALLGTSAALIYGAFNKPKPRKACDGTRLPTSLVRGSEWGLKLFGLIVLGAALATPAILQAVHTDGISWKLGFSLVGILVTAALVCLGWWSLRLIGNSKWHGAGQALAAGGVWAFMAIAPAVMWAGAVEFDSAVVCLNDNSVPQEGKLLANTKDQVFLARHAGHKDTIASLPGSRVRSVRQGDVENQDLLCPPPQKASGG